MQIFLGTVLAPLKPRGSIYQNEFLGEVLLIFDLPGVVIEMGFYWLDQNMFKSEFTKLIIASTYADPIIG